MLVAGVVALPSGHYNKECLCAGKEMAFGWKNEESGVSVDGHSRGSETQRSPKGRSHHKTAQIFYWLTIGSKSGQSLVVGVLFTFGLRPDFEQL